MTIYEKIKELDEEEMIQFLFHFANDTINQFANFQMPNENSIREFLEREGPKE